MMKSANEMQMREKRRLQEHLLLARRVEDDRLVLDDATLAAALDGSRPLTPGERGALQASPLTARRLRQLALERRVQAARPAGAWNGSRGMLRAASGGALEPLVTEDGCWSLHLLDAGAGWRAILQLMPQAPFAPALLASRAPLVVRDGEGGIILAGRLDADGECEAGWPFAAVPAAHLQARGATFTVEPSRP